MPIQLRPGDIDTVFALLREVATRDELNTFLRDKKIPFSAPNVETFLEKRLRSAYDEGKVTATELITLLRTTEEYGAQHILIFKCIPSLTPGYLELGHVRRFLRSQNAEDLPDHPRVLDRPTTREMVDVRWDIEGQLHTLVVKFVETRLQRSFLGEERDADIITRRWKETPIRAVDVVRLRSDGRLEVRIRRHTNATSYKHACNELMLFLAQLLPPRAFSAVHLTKAKDAIVGRRADVKPLIRIIESELRNSSGTVLTAATGHEQGDLFEDASAAQSIGSFLRREGYCDGTNVWWKLDGIGRNGELHTLLRGAENEFVIPSKCLKVEYEYVLGQLLRANR